MYLFKAVLAVGAGGVGHSRLEPWRANANARSNTIQLWTEWLTDCYNNFVRCRPKREVAPRSPRPFALCSPPQVLRKWFTFLQRNKLAEWKAKVIWQKNGHSIILNCILTKTVKKKDLHKIQVRSSLNCFLLLQRKSFAILTTTTIVAAERNEVKNPRSLYLIKSRQTRVTLSGRGTLLCCKTITDPLTRSSDAMIFDCCWELGMTCARIHGKLQSGNGSCRFPRGSLLQCRAC